MIKVIFIGDEPSKTNIHTNVAFVGAKCFTRFAYWISVIKPDYYISLNSDRMSLIHTIKKLKDNNFRVIALGNKASKRLVKYEIKHFQLPHPSGLNRKTNEKGYMATELYKAFDYVRGVKYG